MTAADRWAIWRGRAGLRLGRVRFRRRDYVRMACGALAPVAAVTWLPQGVNPSAVWPREFPKWELSPYRELPDAEALAVLADAGVTLPQGETA